MSSRAAPLSAIPKAKVVELYREALMAGVPLEHVQDRLGELLHRAATTAQMENTQDQNRSAALKKAVPLPARLLSTYGPFLFVLTGLLLVGSAVWPIASFLLFTAPELRASSLLAPIPNEQVLDVVPRVIAGTQVQAKENADSGVIALGPQIQPTIINTELDYVNLSKWFPTLTIPEATQQEQQVTYHLQIPSLDIEDADVKIGGSNLDRSLIQYPGTASPGEFGSPVIFGHSVLRQFYNPSLKNPRRYFSIFSKIMTLKPGEKIYLTFDNVKYTYVVRKKDVVKPEDTFILEQHYDGKFLKLITCVPEGTYLERGVVTAELVSDE